MKNKRFDWGTFIKSVAVIAVPVAMQNLLTTTASMVDTMMLAPLGETTVAAVGLCAQFTSLMLNCYWGFVGGGMLFFAQYWGAKDDRGIDRSYGLTVIAMMTVATVFCLFATAFPELVMKLYTDKENIQVIGIKYLRVVGPAYLFQVWCMSMSCLLRATERVKIPLYASISSVVTNLILNYVFIYGKLGLPAMGVQGAALATLCAAVVNAAVILVLARRAGYPYLFHFRYHFNWKGGFVKQYFTKCFPIICNEVLIGIAMMIINVVLGRQSEEAIAAIAVFRTLEGFVIAFFAGFTNAASVLVGKSIGAGELKTAYERAKRLVPMCAISVFFIAFILVLLRSPILHAMSLSGESYRIGTYILMMYCPIATIRMCNWIQNDTFRSAGDATFGTLLELGFAYAVLIPTVCLVGLRFHLPFLILFFCCYCDEPIRFCLMQMHLYSGKWIRPVTPQGQEALPAFREWVKNRRAKT